MIKKEDHISYSFPNSPCLQTKGIVIIDHQWPFVPPELIYHHGPGFGQKVFPLVSIHPSLFLRSPCPWEACVIAGPSLGLSAWACDQYRLQRAWCPEGDLGGWRLMFFGHCLKILKSFIFELGFYKWSLTEQQNSCQGACNCGSHAVLHATVSLPWDEFLAMCSTAP